MRKKYCSSVECLSPPSVSSVFQCLSRTVEKKRRKFPPSVREIQCVIQRWVLHAWYSETHDETLHQRSYTCIYFETRGLKGEVIFAEERLCFAGMTLFVWGCVLQEWPCCCLWLCFAGITVFIRGCVLQEADHSEDLFPERWPACGGVWLSSHVRWGHQDYQGQDRHEVWRWVLRHLRGHEQLRCVV